MTEYVSQFREYLIEKKAVSENTLQSYMRDIQHFLTFMKEHQFTDLLKADDAMMHLYVEKLLCQNLSNATITRRLASIRCLYQFLMQNYHVTVNPAKHIKLEKSPKKLPHFLNGAEIDLLLAQPNIAEPKGCRDKAILELLYATGIRATELVELNLGDVNLKTGLLRCKGKADRIIPVYPTAVKAVATYITRVRSVSLCDDDTEQPLFVNLNGNRLTRQGFWKIVKGYAEQANITKEITPHTLRHSFALHLLENGADLKDIQTMMGHADISSTQVYVQLLDSHFKEVYHNCHPRAKV